MSYTKGGHTYEVPLKSAKYDDHCCGHYGDFTMAQNTPIKGMFKT